jgi:hypothetical protein
VRHELHNPRFDAFAVDQFGGAAVRRASRIGGVGGVDERAGAGVGIHAASGAHRGARGKPQRKFRKKRGPAARALCYTRRVMNAASLPQLVPILQLAIGPVILISGVGLLQLSLTNRLGRLIDRARLLSRDRAAAGAGDTARIDAQIAIIDRRAGLLQRAVTLGGVTVLLVSVLILVLFVAALLQLDAGLVVVVLFCSALFTLIGSTIFFLQEMKLALEAVRLEIRRP